MTTDGHNVPAESPIEPRHIGFFERRWNMVKAFAKKSYEHLFSVKTWVTAAVIFGGMSLVGQHGGEWGKAAADFFHVGNGVEGVVLRMGQALAVGTMLNAGIAMYKEAKRCDDCDALATQVEQMQRAHNQGKSPQLAQSYEPYLPEQHSPSYTPPVDRSSSFRLP